MHERAGTRVAHAGVVHRKASLFLYVLTISLPATVSAQTVPKLDPPLQYRATLVTGRSPVIVQPLNASIDLLLQSLGGRLGRTLPIIGARAADVPNTALATLAGSALVQHASLDRKTIGLNERTSATVGATAVRSQLGYDGTGIGIALIDSGVTSWHDDLANPAVTGSQRVAAFVDFVNGRTTPYDDYGHGSHVAGIITGNGFDSNGARSGIAPGAQLVVLKTLDGSGSGKISDLIAALDYAVTNRTQYNIRAINLSIGAGVYESYTSDPLAQATQQAVQQGIVVVASAGNNGRTSSGQTQYGGVTAPGNAPWVLTVGASSHQGTIDRSDDIVAVFSSRGPTKMDAAAKPDLVAPGVGTESLSVPGSALYSTYSAYLLNGTVPTSYPPYLSLTGTSMAAPVVTGAVALMLQANPALTPNAVKAILQYTAQIYPGYDALTEGAGFLDAAGAVELAQFFAQSPGGTYPSAPTWSAQITWGNHRVSGGRLLPGMNAWALTTTWGATTASDGGYVAWGQMCQTNCANASSWTVWGASCADSSCSTIAWGGSSSNTVWGTQCGGADCSGTTWSTTDENTVVWGTTDENTVVWGTDDEDTVVWGTSCGQTCQPVIWND
jgi:serine protease AprX